MKNTERNLGIFMIAPLMITAVFAVMYGNNIINTFMIMSSVIVICTFVASWMDGLRRICANQNKEE